VERGAAVLRPRGLHGDRGVRLGPARDVLRRLPWAGLVAGALAAAVLSAVLGYLSLRLKGIYFVLVTFAFNEVFILLLNRWREITGGPAA